MKKIALMILVIVLIGCSPRHVNETVDMSVLEYTAKLTFPAGEVPSEDSLFDLGIRVNDLAGRLDPANGQLLRQLNTSETGELIPCGELAEPISDVFRYTDECFTAFDPTLQILWDVYDFKMGGRYVSVAELADALRFVDFRQVEFENGSVLRKQENVRFGAGPCMPGVIVDIVESASNAEEMRTSMIEIHNCLFFRGNSDSDSYVYELKYPLDIIGGEDTRVRLGNIRLNAGEYIAAIDNDEDFFIERGERYHSVLKPHDGLPVTDVRLAVVVSETSPIQASIFAYALMVMGPVRALEFLDETEGVSGLILTENHEIKVSSGLEESFWR